jgi:hypothetical protein
MLVAGLGPAVAADLGLSTGLAADGPEPLSFGRLEPLASLMQETPAAKILPALAAKLKDGTDLRTLVAAGALANARCFGGKHYEGFHTFMALAPAYHMAGAMPEAERPLPVLKVLYRNTTHMQGKGGRKNEALKTVAPKPLPEGRLPGEAIQNAARKNDRATADALFATVARDTPAEEFDHLLYCVDDEADVHRVVLAWRAWATLDFTGPEHAHTLLRQSVWYCCRDRGRQPTPQIQTLLPKLIDRYKLLGRTLGTRTPDDAWVESLAATIYKGDPAVAADAVAAALAEGFSPEAVGEAAALASTRIVLCDLGRTDGQVNDAKPPGSVHGDSPGVHSSDAVNAWRNIARVSNHRNTVASIIMAGYYAASERDNRVREATYPLAEHTARLKAADAAALLREAEDAIRHKDQGLACAAVQKYGELGGPADRAFALLLKYGVSEDGALHAEKYFRTVSEEFASARAAFKWRHLVALTRVTASEYGYPAPGRDEARKLLGV